MSSGTSERIVMMDLETTDAGIDECTIVPVSIFIPYVSIIFDHLSCRNLPSTVGFDLGIND
jgi:hypothetical protein